MKFFGIQDGGNRYLEIRFLVIIHRRLSDFGEILYGEAEWRADKGHMIKTACSQNPRRRTAAILKIVKLPYTSEDIVGF